MAKSAMKYMVRAWNKELKKPEWQETMRVRSHRKAWARLFAASNIEAIEVETGYYGEGFDANGAIRNQAEADLALSKKAKELTAWVD